MLRAATLTTTDSTPAVFWRPAHKHAPAIPTLNSVVAPTVTVPHGGRPAVASSNNGYGNQNKTVSFISPKDSVLDESARMKLKYGNGKNLVAIGPPKKRGVPAWALPPPGFEAHVEESHKLRSNDVNRASSADVASTTAIKVVSSSATTSMSKPASNSMHSSPFSFGFGVK